MFMLLGISPEMTAAAYRMGDSVINIATPLMSYFPLILTSAQRWDPRFGLGSLMATMLPYAGFFLIASLAMVGIWVALELPLGPGDGVRYEPSVEGLVVAGVGVLSCVTACPMARQVDIHSQAA